MLFDYRIWLSSEAAMNRLLPSRVSPKVALAGYTGSLSTLNGRVGTLKVWVEENQVYVKLVFIVHVGGTRCVTSSTDNIMKIRARSTLTVEFIRTRIFLFLVDVQIQ